MDIHAHRKDEHVFIAEKQYRPIADNGFRSSPPLTCDLTRAWTR